MKQFIYPSITKGSDSIEEHKLLKTDYLLLLAFIILPTSFLCFVDHKIFYIVGLMDYKFLGVLLSMPLILFIKNPFKLFRLAGGKWLFLLCLYIAFNCILSLKKGIPLKEVITIVRFSLIYPIPTLCAVWYLCGVDKERLNKILRIFIIISLVQGILLFIATIIRVDFFIDKSAEVRIFKGAKLVQNLRAFPRYYEPVIVLLTGMVFFVKEKLTIIVGLLMVLLGLPFLVMLRARSASVVLMLAIFYLLYILFIRGIPGKTGVIIKTVIILVIAGISFYAVFPGYVGRYLDKWGIGKDNEEIKAGTLNFRIGLIEEAWERIEEKNSTLTGVGYKREAKKLEYDFVLGTDTYVPPVIFTEGLIGAFFRIMPVLAMLFTNFFRLFQNYEPKLKIISICIVSYILSVLPTIIQTTIFIDYHVEMFFMFMLELIRYNYLAEPCACIEDCEGQD